jgi:hypothetical protein
MKNVEMKLEDNILTIKVDLTKEFGPSSSGKTIIIASTEGNISVPDKDDIKIGLNVYKKKLCQRMEQIISADPHHSGK